MQTSFCTTLRINVKNPTQNNPLISYLFNELSKKFRLSLTQLGEEVATMSNFDLYVSPNVFAGQSRPLDKANFAVFGVPFDSTSTYRTGARFAPNAIREASLNIETYSFRTESDVEDLKLHDLGDLHVSGTVEQTLQRIEHVFKDLWEAKKTPVILGGEHTITLGAMRAIQGEDVAVISFDAHMDLRDQYIDLDISHTTFMRRVREEVHPKKIVEVGTRAACKEELAFARDAEIEYITMKQICQKGVESTVKAIKKIIGNCKRTYLTIDMDVLDPAFAPAVQNPEPEGMSTQNLLDIALSLCDDRLIGFDLVELTPPYDNGITTVLAAKIVFEVLCQVEKARES